MKKLSFSFLRLNAPDVNNGLHELNHKLAKQIEWAATGSNW